MIASRIYKRLSTAGYGETAMSGALFRPSPRRVAWQRGCWKRGKEEGATQTETLMIPTLTTVVAVVIPFGGGG